ncbi:MAG: peptidase S41 [Gammaproteobacteria bacterium]|nr:MAG: peptidase S41 [Gammaproteobacteria bacterium]
MSNVSRYILVLIIGITAGVGLSIERLVFAERAPSVDPIPLEELRTFAEIFGKVKSDYVEKVDDKKLIEQAIDGMLAGLDPHSAYLNPEAFNEMRIGTEGEFGGLGIEVTMSDGFVKIIAPIDDTPAQKAGVMAGDLVVKLNDAPVKGMSLSDAVKIMRGKPGSTIKLTILREGEEKPLEIEIKRAVIHIKSVKSRLLEDDYGYVRITQFQSATGEKLHDAIKKLVKDNKGKNLRGLVLDLRNNPGGVLNAAVSVSDTFLTDGLIVYTDGRVDDSKLRFSADPKDFIDGAPLVVLVNGGSASASEIVAGALQDHKRAVVMGTKTFGKGSVQTILPMNNGAALKITTARYYTPNGRSIQAKGIEPDIVVENLTLSRKEDDALKRLTEADLAGHLENPNSKKPAANTKKTPEQKKNSDKDKSANKDAVEDYQLNEALNLLKAVNILSLNKQQ